MTTGTTTDVKEASAAFFAEFQEEMKALTSLLGIATDPAADGVSATAADPPTEATVAEVKRRGIELEKKVTDAMLFIPTYDLRQCSLQLADLRNHIAALSKPRSKFSFASKRKPAPVPSPATPPAPTSTTAVAPASTPTFTPPPSALTLQSLSHTHIRPSSTASSEIYLLNLSHCIIDLTLLQPTALHLRNVSHCLIVAGVVNGPMLGHVCTGSLIAGACKQVRMHDTVGLGLRIHVPSRPIIEGCTGVVLGSYRELHGVVVVGGDLKATLEAREMAVKGEDGVLLDKSKEMEDFDWLKVGAQSPNWRWGDGRLSERGVMKLKDLLGRTSLEGGIGEIEGLQEVLEEFLGQTY
ncbi:hypothetical protein HK101_001417 [Irineochytrium annulatum]|nr:hypothetical protein HK101_001417 [Irineochytrium annulatum]